jgi:hypothetical protein
MWNWVHMQILNFYFINSFNVNRYSLLPALCTKGIIYSAVREGSWDGESFVSFVFNLMPYMNPWPEPCSVLVMDNCAIHYDPEVADICKER